MSTLWFCERWQANARAGAAMREGGLNPDPKLGEVQLDLIEQYGRASDSAHEKYVNLSYALLGIGALQLILTFLFRKHPGASMLDFGLVSIVGTILVGVAHELHADIPGARERRSLQESRRRFANG
jgi:hypothetical protein